MTSHKPVRVGLFITFTVLAVTLTACIFGSSTTPTPTPTQSGTFSLFTPTLPPPAASPSGISPNFPVTIVIGTGTVFPSPVLPTVSGGGFIVPTVSSGTSEIGLGGSSGSSSANLNVTCTAHNGWVAYTVQTGDTLSSLAQATNTNLTDLIAANCLTNADVIDVGQVIYLPSLPPAGSTGGNLPVTVTVQSGTATNQTAISNVLVEPAQVQSGGQFYVTLGSTVTVRAQGVMNAQSVVFYESSTDVGATPVILGTDNSPADGTGVTWTITDPSMLVRVWAVAIGANGQTAQTPPIVVVTSPPTKAPD